MTAHAYTPAEVERIARTTRRRPQERRRLGLPLPRA